MSVTFGCPRCGHEQTDVRDSRGSPDPVPNIRRRRACAKCDHRFTTREFLDDVNWSEVVDLSRLPAQSRAAVRSLVRALPEISG